MIQLINSLKLGVGERITIQAHQELPSQRTDTRRYEIHFESA